MLLEYVGTSCKGTTFMFWHGQLDYLICHPLNIYGMILIDVRVCRTPTTRDVPGTLSSFSGRMGKHFGGNCLKTCQAGINSYVEQTRY